MTKNYFIFFSIIFNIPRFFELRTEMTPMNQTSYNDTIGENITQEIFLPMVVPTEVRDNLKYSRDYVLIANSIALVFIPILTLIILNSFIFRTISQATQRHNAISSNQRRDHSVSGQIRHCLHSNSAVENSSPFKKSHCIKMGLNSCPLALKSSVLSI